MQTRAFTKIARRARAAAGSAMAAAAVAALVAGAAPMPGGVLADTLPRATSMAPGMMPADFTEVIERVSPSVVNIQVSTAPAAQPSPAPGMPRGMEEFFRRFFGDQLPDGFSFPRPGPEGQQRPEPRMQGIGSGFVIDPDGYIVTNNHVVRRADRITVTMHDGESYTAEVVGADQETDLALLKIDAGHPLPYVSFSEGTTPRPGQWVIAVGNPFGLDHTATAGIVSATGRAIGAGPYDDFIQIDAQINRGNSGGPTFNLKGEVVGVNTAIYSPSGGSVGIGFAIPANLARDVIGQLREHGSVERGWLGVEIQAVTPEIAQTLDLDRARGAIVTRVVPDGPAASAGVRQGDVVLSVNDERVGRPGDLSRGIAGMRPGSTAEIELLRAGKTETVAVTLGTRPSPEELAAAPAERGEANGAVLGMSLSAVDDSARQQYRLEPGTRGVVVTEVAPDSPAAERGVAKGDLIVSVGNQPVGSPGEVARYVEEAKAAGRQAVLMLVRREGADRFVALPVG